MAQITEPQVEQLGDGRLLGCALARGEHLARGVDSDHGNPGPRDRDRDPAGGDPELDDRSVRRSRLLHVEAHVLLHAPAPRVVEIGDGVVRALAYPGLRATHTNSPLVSSKGVRSKSP